MTDKSYYSDTVRELEDWNKVGSILLSKVNQFLKTGDKSDKNMNYVLEINT